MTEKDLKEILFKDDAKTIRTNKILSGMVAQLDEIKKVLIKAGYLKESTGKRLRKIAE